jgi:hypothetical protein
MLTFSLVAPAPAGAVPSVTQARPCERLNFEFDQVEFRASGFSPNARLATSLGSASGQAFADAAGNVLGSIEPPPAQVAGGEQKGLLRVVEADHPENSATTPLRWTSFSLRITPSASFASKRRRFHYFFSGWLPGSMIYAHYTRYGRRVATRRLGRPRGDCGILGLRMSRIPLRRPRPGLWKVWYTTSRRLQDTGPLIREYLFVHPGFLRFQIGGQDRYKPPPPSRR